VVVIIANDFKSFLDYLEIYFLPKAECLIRSGNCCRLTTSSCDKLEVTLEALFHFLICNATAALADVLLGKEEKNFIEGHRYIDLKIRADASTKYHRFAQDAVTLLRQPILLILM
jgi:hypothetical protein